MHRQWNFYNNPLSFYFYGRCLGIVLCSLLSVFFALVAMPIPNLTLVFYGFGGVIRKYTNRINTVAMKQDNTTEKITFDSVKKRLSSIPSYGTKYGNIKIDKIGLKLPIYFGDSMEILSYGVGHYVGSYFPGEGGSIILAGHNDSGYFERILELVKGDEIVIETGYGTFDYSVSDIKIANENDLSAFPIQEEKELLILYTCYPLGIGYKTERFVVYAYKR